MTSQRSIEMTVAMGTKLSMNNNTLNITTDQFQVTSGDMPTPSLSISDDQLSIGAAQLHVTGSLGLSLDGPLETARVTSEPNEELLVDASSGRLRVVGSEGISITDGPGFRGVEMTSNEELSFSSQNGAVCYNISVHYARIHKSVLQYHAYVLQQIVLNSPNVVLSGVHRTVEGEAVYEICVCASGRLYLIPVASSCQNNQGFCNN